MGSSKEVTPRQPPEGGLARTDFMGFTLSVFTRQQLEAHLERLVAAGGKCVCNGYSLWTLTTLRREPSIYRYAEQADILVADGRPFYLLAKLYGVPLRCDISLPNLVFLLLAMANAHGWSVFLLGAREPINARAQALIAQGYPGIRRVGGAHGYFERSRSADVIDAINAFRPHVLLIGMGSPDKERIAIEWRDRLGVNVIVPCGGMIDVLGGKTRATPRLLKKAGLASLFRLAQEPRRLIARTLSVYWFIAVKFLPLYMAKLVSAERGSFSLFEHYSRGRPRR